MEGYVEVGVIWLTASHASLNEPSNFSWLIKGKLAGSARPGNEAQLQWLRDAGIRAIACMNKELPLEEKKVEAMHFEYRFIPVKDFSAPTIEDMKEFVEFVDEMIRQNMPVLACCGAGIGRTGAMLASYLISKCLSPEDALKKVEEKRGFGVESYAQREAVFEYARQIGKCRKTAI